MTRHAHATLSLEPLEAPSRSATPSVLLAEDDAQMRRLLREQLLRERYTVREAATGGALFEELRSARGRREPPSLLLTDLRMPGVSVLDLIPVIRGWGWTFPVLLITAFGDEEIRAEALSRGVTAMLSKPFDLEDLSRTLRELLRP